MFVHFKYKKYVITEKHSFCFQGNKHLIEVTATPYEYDESLPNISAPTVLGIKRKITKILRHPIPARPLEL